MPWPAGLYTVTLISIEQDDRVSQFNDGPRAAWTFGVDSIIRITPVPDPATNRENKAKAQAAIAEGMTLNAWTNISMNRKATMRGYIEALLGRTLANGEGCNPADVIGKKAEATLEEYTGQDGTQKVKLASLAPISADDDPL